MPDLSHKDIDKLFRQGAERYDFEFKEEAWEQMETLLKRDRRRRLWWWLLGILLALALSYGAYHFLINRSPDEAAPTLQEQQPPVAGSSTFPPRQPATSKEKTGEKAALHDNRPADRLSTTERERSGADAQKDLLPAVSPNGSKPGEVSNALPDGLAEAPAATGNTREPAATSRATSRRHFTPFHTLPAINPLMPRKQQKRLSPSSALPPLTPSPLIKARSRAEAVALLPTTNDEQLAVAGQNQKPPNSLVLGLNFSPESASIGTDDFGEVDFKAGLSLEYRFATHFGAGAGIHYTRKHYRAGPGEYTPEYGFWTNRISPNQTYGYCSMLEVPLNITYFLHQHDRNSFFLEAGLTSFVMLNEHYWYAYDRPDPDLIRYWQSNFEYHAWMSILNISPGYQVRINRRFGIQAAPFFQVPLTGIGHGKVDLYSLGLNLRVLWHTK